MSQSNVSCNTVPANAALQGPTDGRQPTLARSVFLLSQGAFASAVALRLCDPIKRG